MVFEFTQHDQDVSNQLWAITSLVGAVLCFMVLLVIGIAAIHPRSRSKLDRVSFRMVVYALIANTIYGASNAAGGMMTGPNWGCGFSVFLLQLTLEMSSFLAFCIALNLYLVIVRNKNGHRLEKFYVIFSVIIAFIIAIPPYAAGQYGFDPIVKDCWYTNPNPNQRLAWQIGTQLVWTFMTVIGEVILSTAVLVFMLKHIMLRKRMFASVHTSSHSKRHIQSTTSTDTVSHSQATMALGLKNIIVRIALYPIASCIINLISMACVLHATINDGLHSRMDYNIVLLSDFLYGFRAIAYAFLAACDPALVRAIKCLLTEVIMGRQPAADMSWHCSDRSGHTSETASTPQHPVVHVELSTFRDPPFESDDKFDQSTYPNDGRDPMSRASFLNFSDFSDSKVGSHHQSHVNTHTTLNASQIRDMEVAPGAVDQTRREISMAETLHRDQQEFRKQI